MSGAHAKPVVAEADTEHRPRKGVFYRGRHRRTSEAWKAMEREIATMQGERDQANQELQQLKQSQAAVHQQMTQLRQEVRQLRALMGGDPNNPANQNTHSVTMPERPRDDSDPAEIITHPIPVAELFGDEPFKRPNIPSMRPEVKIYPFPDRIPPMPKKPPTVHREKPSLRPVPPDTSERVQDVTATQIMNLWDAPFAKPPQDARRSA
jgi:hypothetical protein